MAGKALHDLSPGLFSRIIRCLFYPRAAPALAILAPFLVLEHVKTFFTSDLHIG